MGARASVEYRIEGAALVSWRYVVDGCRSILYHGATIPKTGTMTRAVFDGLERDIDVFVHLESPVITAADLSEREIFDPRRIYRTPNGTHVCYKRKEENCRIVLWSFKTEGEISISGSMILEPTDVVSRPTAASARRMTQKLLAAFLIANNPSITADELVRELREAFPTARIGDRHGAHYLSHSRCGRLPEAPDTDPREW